MTTRERKLKFLKDGGLSIHVGAREMLSERGADWLTDDQIADLVRYLIDVEKRALRRYRQNRKVASVRRAGDRA